MQKNNFDDDLHSENVLDADDLYAEDISLNGTRPKTFHSKNFTDSETQAAADKKKSVPHEPELKQKLSHAETSGVAISAVMLVYSLAEQDKPLFFLATALLTFLFPVATLLPEMLQARSEAGLQTKPRSKAACVLFTAAPVLAFALTVFLCYEMEWLVAHLSRYGLGTFVARFEQGGISFQYYGFPLIGHPILTDGSIKATLNGSVHSLTVMDNTFASYAIMRGMIWMVWCLAWLCLANWRAYKRRDYRLLLLSIIILIFGLMERPGLDVWYNFMLLYPLAAIVELPKKKKSAAVGKKTAKKGKSK